MGWFLPYNRQPSPSRVSSSGLTTACCTSHGHGMAQREVQQAVAVGGEDPKRFSVLVHMPLGDLPVVLPDAGGEGGGGQGAGAGKDEQLL